MGREKKKVEYYNGRWKGKYLSDEDCNKLDMVRAYHGMRISYLY